MTIHLPKDIESSIEAAVHRGHFASVDDAMTEAARRLLRELNHEPQAVKPGLGLIGALRDDAEFLDQAVEHAMKVREERPWRVLPGE